MEECSNFLEAYECDLNLKDVDSYCDDEHKYSVKIFCVLCNKFVCDECFLDSHYNHRKPIILEQSFQKTLAFLKSLQAKLDLKIKITDRHADGRCR